MALGEYDSLEEYCASSVFLILVAQRGIDFQSCVHSLGLNALLEQPMVILCCHSRHIISSHIQKHVIIHLTRNIGKILRSLDLDWVRHQCISKGMPEGILI